MITKEKFNEWRWAVAHKLSEWFDKYALRALYFFFAFIYICWFMGNCLNDYGNRICYDICEKENQPVADVGYGFTGIQCVCGEKPTELTPRIGLP